MTFLGYLLMQAIWTVLATIPAAVGAILYSRYSAGSAHAKTWVCRLALVSALLVFLAIGFEVQASLRHEKPSGELAGLTTAIFSLMPSIWLAGAALRGLRILRARKHVREVRACSAPLPAHIEDKLRPACPSRVELRASDFVATVMIVYGRRPTMVIPTRFLYDQDLPIAVSHELAHLHHRDSIWNLVYEAVAAILWFSPAILRLGHRLRICQELAADAAAIKRHNCGASRYGQMLLRFADVQPAASPFMAAFGGKGDMVERLEALKPRRPWVRAASALAAVMVLALMVPVRSEGAPSFLARIHHSLHRLHH